MKENKPKHELNKNKKPKNKTDEQTKVEEN